MNEEGKQPSSGLDTHERKVIAKHRSPVFTSENWGIVWNAAMKLPSLRVQITDSMIDKGDTLLQVSEKVNALGHDLFIAELTPVLAEAKAADNSPLFNQDESTVILNAVTSRDLEALPSDDLQVEQTALALAHVADRARTKNLMTSLQGFSDETLKGIGMDRKTVTIASGLVDVTNKTNAEFLRVDAQLRAEADPSKQSKPHTAPEYGVMHRQLLKLADSLEKNEQMNTQADKDFIAYIRIIGDLMDPRSGETGKLKTNAQMERIPVEGHRVGETRDFTLEREFCNFYSRHPDYPVIFLPGIAKALDLGMPDPEVRILQQTSERQHEYKELRDQYIKSLHTKLGSILSEQDMADLRRQIPLNGISFADYGIALKRPYEAQSQQNVILMMDYPEYKTVFLRRAQIYMQELLPDSSEYADIVESDNLHILKNYIVYLHELGHRVKAVETEGAQKLKEKDDEWSELKSDVLALVASYDVLKAKAEELFPGKGKRALNLTMINYLADCFASSTAGGDDAPYFLSAQRNLQSLLDAGVLKGMEDKITINESRLEDDLSEVFMPVSKELLSLYDKAADTPSGMKMVPILQSGDEIIHTKSALLTNLYERLRPKIH